MAALGSVAEIEDCENMVRFHLEDIARSQIARHRKHLASLSSEQQSEVELLLVSITDLISHQVIDGSRRYPESVRKKIAGLWSGAVTA